jgi:hypothetical protein
LRHKRERERELVVYIKAQQEHQEPLYRSRYTGASQKQLRLVSFVPLRFQSSPANKNTANPPRRRRRKKEGKKEKKKSPKDEEREREREDEPGHG